MNLQSDEEVHPAVLADAKARPLEVNKRHGQQILFHKSKNNTFAFFFVY